jgi:hypothetical protein
MCKHNDTNQKEQMMIQKSVLAISGVFLLLSLGVPATKAASTLPGTKSSCTSSYDVTWYDSSNSVISTTTTSDLSTTLASPPTGAVEYMWIDQTNDPATENYYCIATPTAANVDLSTATTNTDPNQDIELIYNSL